MRKEIQIKIIIALIFSVLHLGGLYAQVTVNPIGVNTVQYGVINSIVQSPFDQQFYTAGKSEGIFTLTKHLDHSNQQWMITGTPSNVSELAEVVIGPDNNIYVTGYFFGTLRLKRSVGSALYSELISNGGADAFIASYTPSGNLRWVRTVGNVEHDIGVSITAGNDRIYVGTIQMKSDINSGVANSPMLSFLDISAYGFNGDKLSGQNLSVRSNNDLLNINNDDNVYLLLQSLKADIVFYEDKVFAVLPFMENYIIGNSASDIEIVNNTDSNVSLALIKLDESLNLEWHRHLKQDDTDGNFHGLSITADCSGVYVSGGFNKNSNLGVATMQNLEFETSLNNWSRFEHSTTDTYTFLKKFNLEDGYFKWLHTGNISSSTNNYQSTATYFDCKADQYGSVWVTGHSSGKTLAGDQYAVYTVEGPPDGQSYELIEILFKVEKSMVYSIDINTGKITSVTRSNEGNSVGYSVHTMHNSTGNKLLMGGASILNPSFPIGLLSSKQLIGIGEYTNTDLSAGCCNANVQMQITATTTDGFCLGNELTVSSDQSNTIWYSETPNGTTKLIDFGTDLSFKALVPNFSIYGKSTNSCGTSESAHIPFSMSTETPSLTCIDQTIPYDDSCTPVITDIQEPDTILSTCSYDIVTSVVFPINGYPGTIEYSLDGEVSPPNLNLISRDRRGDIFPFKNPLNLTSGNFDIGSNNSFIGSKYLSGNINSIDPSSLCEGQTCESANYVQPVLYTSDVGNSSTSYIVSTNETIIVGNTDYNGLTIDDNWELTLSGNGVMRINGDVDLGLNSSIRINGDVRLVAKNISLSSNAKIIVDSGSLILETTNDFTLSSHSEMITTLSTEILVLSNNIYIGAFTVLNGLFYATDEINIDNGNTIHGSLCGGGLVDVMTGNTITYSDHGRVLFNSRFGLTEIDTPIIHPYKNLSGNNDEIFYYENSNYPIIDYLGTDNLDSEGNGLTWSIDPLFFDGGLFNIDQEGVLKFNTSPDYENTNPLHSYKLKILLTDVSGNVGNLNVVVKVLDMPSMPTYTCNSSISVIDNTSPTANCVSSFTLPLDDNGLATLYPSNIDNGSVDNCATSLNYELIFPAGENETFDCGDVNATLSVELKVTDDSGNTNSCFSILNISDQTDPIAVCQDVELVLSSSENETIDPNDLSNTSTDACGTPTASTLSQTLFAIEDVGTNIIDITITDANGNTNNCQSTVTVIDDMPTALCQDITVYLDAFGMVSINTTQIDNGSSDNSATPILTLDKYDFDCSDIGVNTVVLTVSDGTNLSTCEASVTVEDNINPILDCITAPFELNLSDSGNAILQSTDVVTASDNCTLNQISLSQTVFTCLDIGGVLTISVTAEDISGNGSGCLVGVIVKDIDNPQANCHDNTLSLDINGNVIVAPSDIDNGSIDACGIIAMSVSPDTFNSSNMGENSVTLTVEDSNGNTATCTAIITIEDNLAPIASCTDTTLYLNNSGQVNVPDIDLDGGSTDNGVIATIIASQTNFDCTNTGNNNVILTVTDINGNFDTCTSIVTVLDTISPTVTAQDITVYLNATGSTTFLLTDIVNTSGDNCTPPVLTVDENTFGCAEVGTNIVILTATDASGNTTTDQAMVSVVDNTAPLAICQDTNVYLNANGDANITENDIDNGSSDICGIATMTLDNSTFTITNLGSNAVEMTVLDNNGNVSSCIATVTVVDTTIPIALCNDTTLYLNGVGEAIVTNIDLDGGSTDNGAIATIIASQTNFDCTDTGNNNVTLTVTDTGGNTEECTAIVTVLDTINPTVSAQDIIIYLDAFGSTTILPTDVVNASADNCSSPVLTIDEDAFDCAEEGDNLVTITVTDVSGNFITDQVIVTVLDTISPIAVCQAITIGLDANGDATINGNDIDNGSTDACGIVNMMASTTDFTSINLGDNDITLTVTDSNGNNNTCIAVVTITDSNAPIAICQNITVELDAGGSAFASADDVNNNSTDNGVIVSTELNITEFSCANVGVNEVVLSVTDDAQNVSTCIANVTVEDNTIPTVACQDVYISLDEDGEASVSSVNVVTLFHDNCSISSLNLSDNEFNCEDIGVNSVTVTVKDPSNNEGTCIAEVTVIDDVSPVIQNCPQGTLTFFTEANNCEAVVNYSEVVATDNCAINSMESSINIDHINGGNTMNVGIYNQSYSFYDHSGNAATCEFIIEVKDTITPVINNCQDNLTLNMDENACGAVVTLQDIDPTDNCGLQSVIRTDVSGYVTGDLFSLGNTTISYLVTDVNGNEATCSYDITVEDNVYPTLSCATDTLNISIGDGVTLNETWFNAIDYPRNDNCEIASFIPSIDNEAAFNFSCDQVNSIFTVDLLVTDVSDNSTSCEAFIKIVDDTNPNIICNDFSLQIPASNSAPLYVSYLNNGSTDNCTIDNIWLDITEVDLDDVGTPIQVVLTGEDTSGNTSSCISLVTVLNGNPEIECENTVVELDQNGSYSLDVPSLVSVENNGTPITEFDSFTPSLVNYNCADLGNDTIQVILVTTTQYTKTCDIIVVIQDNIAPVLTCPETQSVNLNSDCQFELIDYTDQSSVVENCNVDNIVYTQFLTDSPTLSLGEMDWIWEGNVANITIQATDGSGNESACNFNIEVDQSASILAVNCPENVQFDAVDCGINVQYDQLESPVVTAGCGVAMSNNLFLNEDPVYMTLGTTDITWTITALVGQQTQCVQTIVVNDVQAPLITCPDNVIQCLPPELDELADLPVIMDQCGGETTLTSSMTNEELIYSIKWSVTDEAGNENFCIQTYEDAEYVSTPDAGEDENIGLNSMVTLSGNIPEIGSAMWIAPMGVSLDNPEDVTTTATNLSEGENIFIYEIFEEGCISLTDTVHIFATTFFMPTGFSPNGDGINDLLVINGITTYPESILTVFDRTGKIIFKEIGYQNNWGGTGINGAVLPKDTYFFILDIPNGNSIKGSIEIKH